MDPHTPDAIALDGSDDLYVASYRFNGRVSIYGPGATTPSRIISTEGWFTSMALDPGSNLYVAWQGLTRPWSGKVRVYSPRGTKAIVKLGGPQGVRNPGALIIGP
jgi:hypothetical protein